MLNGASAVPPSSGSLSVGGGTLSTTLAMTPAEAVQSLVDDEAYFESLYTPSDEDNTSDDDGSGNGEANESDTLQHNAEPLPDTLVSSNVQSEEIKESTLDPLVISDSTLHIAGMLFDDNDGENCIIGSNDSNKRDKALPEFIKDRDSSYLESRKKTNKGNLDTISDKKPETYDTPSQNDKGPRKVSLFERNKDRIKAERTAKNKQLVEYINSLSKLELETSKQKMDSIMSGVELIYKNGCIGKQWIAVVDMDAFFASVEELDHPEYKSLPLGVGGNSMLSTANYTARKFGIKAGVPGFKGKQKCPNLIIVPPNFPRYEEVSSQVMDILAEYDPQLRKASIDEAYLNLTTLVTEKGIEKYRARNFDLEVSKVSNRMESQELLERMCEEAVLEIVNEMRNRIKTEVGVTASAGISSSCLVAKMCSNVNKPDGQTLIRRDRASVKNFVNDLPVRKAHGIGGAMEHLLNDIGIITLKDLRDNLYKLALVTTPKHFTSLFYKAMVMDPPNGDEHPEELLSLLKNDLNSYTAIRDVWFREAVTSSLPKSIGTERTFYSVLGIKGMFDFLLKISCSVQELLDTDIHILDKDCQVDCKEVQSKGQLYTGPACVLKIKFADFSFVTRSIGITESFVNMCTKRRGQMRNELVEERPEAERSLFYFLSKRNVSGALDRKWCSQQVALRCWEVLFNEMECRDPVENNVHVTDFSSAILALENEEFGSRITIGRQIRQLGISAVLIPRRTAGAMDSWLDSARKRGPEQQTVDGGEPHTSDTEDGGRVLVKRRLVEGSLEDHVVASMTRGDPNMSKLLATRATSHNNFTETDPRSAQLTGDNNNSDNDEDDMGFRVLFEDAESDTLLLSRRRHVLCPVCGKRVAMQIDTVVGRARFETARDDVLRDVDADMGWERKLAEHIDVCLV